MANHREKQQDSKVTDIQRWLESAQVQSSLEFCPVHGPGMHEDQDKPASVSLMMPGSFNPLHAAHLEMARIASDKLQQPCWFEISINNVDKDKLDQTELADRIQQDFGRNGLVVSNAPRFVEKSELFAGVTFVVGADTILRFADLKYYNGSRQRRKRAIETIHRQMCRFLVFGRRIENTFTAQKELSLPGDLKAICAFVSADEFAMDVSSSEMKRLGLN